MYRSISTYAKPILLAIIVYACLGIALPRQAQATIVEKYLSVPDRRQEQSLWCWGASGQMVLAYKGITASQCGVVYWGKYPRYTSCGNRVGDVYEVAQALRHYGLSQSNGDAGSLTMLQIKGEIDASRPVVAAWWTSWFGGHMVVIRGYKWNYRDNTRIVYYVDPDPDNGGYKWLHYDQFYKAPDHTWTFTTWKNSR